MPVTAWNELRLTPRDLWLVPEGWVNALTPGLQAGARCLVYVQNWAYLFSSLPPGVSWHDLPVSFLAVSRPVAWFIRQTLGKDAPVLPPGLDSSLFSKPRSKPAGRLRVAYMPRKNKALAEMIRAAWEARHHGAFTQDGLLWEEIHGQDQAGVARKLQDAHIFLATGFPEGFSLPPLEAMACGCLPVGFAGLGGWDYMSQIGEDAWRPWWSGRSGWPVDQHPWSGNGFWVPDGDVLAAVLALEKAVELWKMGGSALHAALEAGERTVQAYALDRQLENVQTLWSAWFDKNS